MFIYIKVRPGSALNWSTLRYIKSFRKTKAWLLSMLALVITFKMFDKNWREDTVISVQNGITETECVR